MGVIVLFLLFSYRLTKQISFLSTIDSSKIVQLIEDPLNRVENVFRYLNKDLPQDMSLKQYFAGKVAEVLNINVIQNFLGSIFGVLGNVAVAIFSISFITFFFLKDQHLFFESILMRVPEKYTDNFTSALYTN